MFKNKHLTKQKTCAILAIVRVPKRRLKGIEQFERLIGKIE